MHVTCTLRSAPVTLEKAAEKTEETYAFFLTASPSCPHTGSMSECVGLHSTCHAASLRRLCIRAHGFSNSLKGVLVDSVAAGREFVHEFVHGMASPRLARGSSWIRESPGRGWASPDPLSYQPPPVMARPRAPPPQRGLRQDFEGRPLSSPGWR